MDLFEYAQKQETHEAIYTVSELTSEVKSLITARYGRDPFWVKGELSNYRGRNQSGHMYFRLKDSGAVLNCVYFRNANRKLTVDLTEGTSLLAFGRLDLWEQGGNYQLIVEDLRIGGTGELYLRFEMLKKKLEAEGLFDPARKKPLPEFPRRIGIITSPTGAAVRDILHILEDRCRFVRVLICPVKVQGEGAAEEIASAITELNDPKYGVDLLLLGRGGGSIEDLWAFNEEKVARAIAVSSIPVISAVGHQTDTTISDFVADLRAATPSEGAKMAVPDMAEAEKRTEMLMRNIVREITHVRSVASERLGSLLRSPMLRDPEALVRSHLQMLDLLTEKMTDEIGANLKSIHFTFEKMTEGLGHLNPLAILSRGYGVIRTGKGRILRRAADVSRGEELQVRLHEGELGCQVTKISG
ncbi:MAG: exodeoxyribonuclease VII large subunit [Pseudomonadota bacterium]